MLQLLLLLVGVAGLWGGTVLTLGGAVRLSERSGMSKSFVGLTVLAIGTDLPELFVSVGGSLHRFRGIDASGLIVGDALGSAIAQGTLVLGLAALLGYLAGAPRLLRRQGVTLLLAVALLVALGFDGALSRLEGAALLLAWIVQLVLLLRAEREETPTPLKAPSGPVPDVLIIMAGLILVALAAQLVVLEGVTVATRWGVSQNLIGLLVVGVGTSLPELILAIGAATRGEASLAVGSVLGSNVFDLLVPLGAGAALFPLGISDATLRIDLPAVALGTVLLLWLASRRDALQRREGFVLVGFFAVYALIRVVVG